jgi:hypothetical protein
MKEQFHDCRISISGGHHQGRHAAVRSQIYHGSVVDQRFGCGEVLFVNRVH